MQPTRQLFPPPAVWLCSECGDVYEAAPPDGHCPNPGHAGVKLTFATIRPLRRSSTGARRPDENHRIIR